MLRLRLRAAAHTALAASAAASASAFIANPTYAPAKGRCHVTTSKPAIRCNRKPEDLLHGSHAPGDAP
jgi:hypothetical protein